MNFSPKYILLACFYGLFMSQALANLESISIVTDRKNLENSISAQAINDCLSLLRQACDCDVQLNNPQAQIVLQMPEILPEDAQVKSRFAVNISYPYLDYPNHDYSWYSQRIGEQLLMQLQTVSHQGISCGLYGLLQEQLWFGFYHPKETYIPELKYWPLTESFYWHAQARFDKKGFHLHTMHPLELTEALLDVRSENGQAEIKKYIDWLARNQQNYMEFCLLNSIDTAKWADYIRPMVEYGHSKGILMGVDLSLNMKQQKAYRLYQGNFLTEKQQKAQIERNLEVVCRNVGWDVVNMEMSGTEFSSGNVSRRNKLRDFINELVQTKYKAKLVGRQHVVKTENMRAGKGTETTLSSNPIDKSRGLLVHTVMFYGLFDKECPVYENQNFSHLLASLQANHSQRETWYYPESAYWVTFDNSVPMFLTPYLNARLDDIERLDSLKINKGHITFSSGWEWGYWFIDWSIARWSWRHEINGTLEVNTASQYIGDLFRREKTVSVFAKMMSLQHNYLKEKNLIRYLCPSSVTDEMPNILGLNMEFQPRPEHKYKWWRYKAPYDSIAVFKRHIAQLDSFHRQAERILEEFVEEERVLAQNFPAIKPLFGEFITAFKVTSLRAKHRVHTLNYLLSKREAKLGKSKDIIKHEELEKAAKIREKALVFVKNQESKYRYPADWIAKAKINHTSYNFGYLYPVSELQLWQREEEQYKNDKYSPFYFSIWNVSKVMGWEK